MNTATQTTEDLVNQEISIGFVTEIETDTVPRGLNEATVRLISAKKNEPGFMLDWRLKAYRHWVKLAKSQAEPKWANVHYPKIDFQELYYYSAPKKKDGPKSLDEIDPELARGAAPGIAPSASLIRVQMFMLTMTATISSISSALKCWASASWTR